MTIANIEFSSQALQRTAEYVAFIPDPQEAGPGPYPVLLQLHGYHDNRRAWMIKSNLWGHWQRYPLIIVMPETANGWWANMGIPNNWEDYIVQDLVSHVGSTFPVREGKMAIGGLSMGGFGAIRLGLKYPHLFSSIWAHSSAIFNPDKTAMAFVWDDPDRSSEVRAHMRNDLNCYYWAAMLQKEIKPRLTFDCGTEDFLIDQNRDFHTYLQKQKLPHSYMEHPGGHTWEYWDLHVQAALVQHAEVLEIMRKPEQPPMM